VNWVIQLTFSRAVIVLQNILQLKEIPHKFHFVMLQYSEVTVSSRKFLCHNFCYSYVGTAIVLRISEIKSTLNCVKKISYSFNSFNVLAVILFTNAVNLPDKEILLLKQDTRRKHHEFLISNFRRVVNVLCFFFFWVIPRRLNLVCRRFGTLYIFHLHRHRVFRNVGIPNLEARELPRKKTYKYHEVSCSSKS
jgi:hypothetical protein